MYFLVAAGTTTRWLLRLGLTLRAYAWMRPINRWRRSRNSAAVMPIAISGASSKCGCVHGVGWPKIRSVNAVTGRWVLESVFIVDKQRLIWTGNERTKFHSLWKLKFNFHVRLTFVRFGCGTAKGLPQMATNTIDEHFEVSVVLLFACLLSIQFLSHFFFLISSFYRFFSFLLASFWLIDGAIIEFALTEDDKIENCFQITDFFSLEAMQYNWICVIWFVYAVWFERYTHDTNVAQSNLYMQSMICFIYLSVCMPPAIDVSHKPKKKY